MTRPGFAGLRITPRPKSYGREIEGNDASSIDPRCVATRASIRHRLGRRYGFQFLDLNPAQLEMIRTSLARRVH